MVPALVLKLYYHGGIGAVRTLGRFGVPVYAIHSDPGVPAARSRYLRDVVRWDFDRASVEDSLELVLRVGSRLGHGTVLIAADDTAQEFASTHSGALRSTFRFPLQRPGLTERLYSKRGLYELCLEHGVPSPTTEFPQEPDEARRMIGRAKFPLVLKPVDKMRFQLRNGIAMYIARDRSDALTAYERLEDPAAPNLMLQEYLPGPSSSVWVYTGYFDAQSELRFGAGGRKLRQYPVGTGTTCYGVVESSPRLERLTKRFVKALGYVGVFDCGYRYDSRDGSFKLLDVNPRVGANFRQCVGRNGMDVVRAMYLDLCGEAVPADVPDEGRVWWVENYDLAAAVRSVRDGDLSLGSWVRSLCAVDEPAWFARDDLSPFVTMCFGAVKAAGGRVRSRIG